MRKVTALLLLGAAAGLAACDTATVNKTVDHGLDRKDLSQLEAGIWVDPTGCDHWIIDDGFEGYLSQRLSPEGKPVCSGIAPPGVATGPYKGDSWVSDIL
ncbi:hypothetical protein [Chachezhania sediminis]|uniref:hypothetical protein n=1 Tax=Chachezhania sediminis TaxID=2599291 RepID=UPI00131C28C9|nr:hypothetical protein [Chachezhania sediminis]